jgi:flavorubredoxin
MAGRAMDIRTDEVAAGIFRVSVFLPQAQGGAGFMFNHFLIVGDEPMLFHCGLRKMFPVVSRAVGRIIPIQTLRWLGFGHFEADEFGSMNEWLAASPHAQVTHGAVGCRVSIADMADRPPRVLADGEIVDLGGKRVRYIDTPMYRMDGTLASCLKKPLAPFSAATFSRDLAVVHP